MADLNLRYQDISCYTCRYFRTYDGSNGHSTDECLLLGRTLSVAESCYVNYARVCDGWKRRPKVWDVICDQNPHWHDIYIKRKTLLRLREKHHLTRRWTGDPDGS